MTTRFAWLAGAAALAGAALPSAASAQPLAVTVNPLALPAAIISAPFDLLTPPQSGYDPGPAVANAVGYTPDGWAVVRTPVLRQTGPRYVNPAVPRGTPVVVVRRGSTVPAYVETAPAESISVPGLVQGATYDFFVAPSGRVVFLDPVTRQVARVTR